MADNMCPIILAHGIARFDILREIFLNKLGIPENERGGSLHYFKGIKSHLEANGFKVYHSNVDFAGPVDLRAAEMSNSIKQVLEETDSHKVHIIAHSMGGLDARHMIVDHDMADKVASLTTIGTPHLGTSFADFGISHGGKLVIDGLKSIMNLEGFKDLTTSACESFNLRARDKEVSNGVVYRTYASAEDRNRVFLPLQPSWLIISKNEGENDGLVSVRSQRWVSEIIGSDGTRKTIEQLRFPIPADHLNEVGWWDPQETNPLSVLLNAGKQAKEYEDKIKGIYLEMVKSL